MQIIRFGAVGAANTLIDLLILNLLMFLFGATSGPELLLCNATAFSVANLNSYLLNKRWTFSDRRRETTSQFLLFLLFSAGGLVVNSTVLYLLTAWDLGIAPVLWANMAKIGATGASMVWNFLTYRQIVFRQGEASQSPPRPLQTPRRLLRMKSSSRPTSGVTSRSASTRPSASS